ncbi:MAG: thymidylate synthase [Candidatus Woesearchaeota archaeon]
MAGKEKQGEQEKPGDEERGKQWPVCFSEQMIIGSRESNVSIITLWTQKEPIAEKLDRESYATIGQLYSKAGINAVLRNVLANPSIRYIIVCGADKSGSGEALLSLAMNGIDDNHNISGVENAHIEKEIPAEAVEEFRRNVEVIDMRGVTDPAGISRRINSLESRGPFAEPKFFPAAKPDLPERYPTDPSVFKVRAGTIGIAWLTVLSKIMKFGHNKRSHHSSGQKELLNIVAVITGEDPENIAWYEFFNFTRKELEEYYPQVLTSRSIKGINYTYGQRLMDYNGIDQIKSVIEKLKKEPFTRRAIAVTWEADKDVYNKNAPCLDLVNFIVQDNKLFMNAYFRSHDMYRGWPQNCFALRKLQKHVSDETGIPMGDMTIFSASAHIYEENINEVQEIIDMYYEGPEHEWDPRGNMVIGIDRENMEIVISHQSHDGRKLEELRGSSVKELAGKLEKHHTISQTAHALDIGSELQKAYIAMRNGLEYVQDNDIKI